MQFKDLEGATVVLDGVLQIKKELNGQQNRSIIKQQLKTMVPLGNHLFDQLFVSGFPLKSVCVGGDDFILTIH